MSLEEELEIYKAEGTGFAKEGEGSNYKIENRDSLLTMYSNGKIQQFPIIGVSYGAGMVSKQQNDYLHDVLHQAVKFYERGDPTIEDLDIYQRCVEHKIDKATYLENLQRVTNFWQTWGRDNLNR